jgi:manganese/zinc/iron transport system permease protein
MSILFDYTFQIVSLGSVLLGFISGIVGAYATLSKKSLIGDVISHSSLPGVVLAFMIFNSKNTSILLLGALISGLFSVILINIILKNSKLKPDTVFALILSVFFGFGMVLLTYIQKTPNANQAGLDRFIFGQASTLLISDIKIILYSSIIILLIIVLFYKELLLFIFDPIYCSSLKISIKLINFIMSFIFVTNIIVGLQSVGIILISSLLIAPSIAARQWTNKFTTLLILSGIFGSVSGFLGTFTSSLISNISTGPTIVLYVSLIIFISIIFSPSRGLLQRYVKNKRGNNYAK